MTGALVLVVAGLGAAFITSATDDPAFNTNYQSIASVYSEAPDGGDVDISRSFDREMLEKQTEQQAEQRESALNQLVDKTEKRAQELKVNQWVVPVVGYRISSRFGTVESVRGGRAHGGVDLAAPSGSTIVAVAGGVVTKAGFSGGCGNATMVRLDDGWQMMYCHQSSITVNVGDRIEPGQRIGYVGSTGNSTGPHLHLEVWQPNNTRVDPVAKLAEHGVIL